MTRRVSIAGPYEEEILLVECHMELGVQWTEIAKLFPFPGMDTLLAFEGTRHIAFYIFFHSVSA